MSVFESDGVYAGVPYRVSSDGSIDALLNGTIVRFKTMDGLLDAAHRERDLSPIARQHLTQRELPPLRINWKIVIFLGFVALVLLIFAMPASVNHEILRNLKADVAKCSQRITAMKLSGLILRIDPAKDSADVIVDDVRWNSVDHDSKVIAAMYPYCVYSPTDGRYTVYIKGSRDRKIKGSILNGNWWSN